MGADDEEGDRLAGNHVSDREHHVLEQIQGKSVAPVEIVDDEEGGGSLGQLDDRAAHRHEELQLLVVGFGGRGWIARGWRRMRELAGALGIRTETLPAALGMLLRQGKQRFDERQGWQRKIPEGASGPEQLTDRAKVGADRISA